MQRTDNVPETNSAMTETAHILIVDDEPDIRESFEEYLELKGYRTSCADGGQSARRIVAEQNVDLALLDVAMPGEDGLSLARFLRERTSVAIIIVASAGEVMDRIVGIEVGADDYLPKPVDLREMSARIEAVLRRRNANLATAPTFMAGANEKYAQFGDCRLGLESHTLSGAAGQEIPITAMDFQVLTLFAENPGRTLSRDRIFDLTRARSRPHSDRSVDIQIGRIRRKIEADPKKPRVIKTVHGTGYVYTPNVA